MQFVLSGKRTNCIRACEFSKNKLIEGGISKDKVTCVPTFIDATSITPCYEDDKYFLFLGRMAHQKGPIYKRKEECCGCTACYAICPKEAISMVEDEEGFEYPQIDESKCVRCYQCLKVCPFKVAKASGM